MYQTLDTIQPEQIDGLIKAHNYKFISLQDSAARALVPYNTGGKDALKNRVTEIKQRLQVVPDNSIYYLLLKNGVKGEEWAYKIIKGNPIQIINTAPAPSSMSEPTQYANYADKVSEQAAEIARLKNEIDNLKLSFMYESKLAEMNAKIAQLSEPREPEKNVFQGFAENILPTFIPLFEKYLDVRQLEAQNKIATPQLSEQKTNTTQQLPAVGSAQYNRMIDRLGELSDDEFNTRINYLAAIDQNYADTVLNEFTTDDEPQTPSDEE
jgi:hypothetical protein